jgi:putative endonuclease
MSLKHPEMDINFLCFYLIFSGISELHGSFAFLKRGNIKIKQQEVYYMHYVYIVECKDGTLYTGWTTDIEKRIKQHNCGKGAKYTRSRYPVTLKYCAECITREEAQKKEYAIKQLHREQKIRLIHEGLF